MIEARCRKADEEELRRFALTLFYSCILLGIFLLFKGKKWACILCGAGLGLLAVRRIEPGLLRPLNRGWRALATTLSSVTSHILLGVMFYLVFVPLGVGMRLCGREPLKKRIEKKTSTYWIKKEGNDSPEQYEKMF